MTQVIRPSGNSAVTFLRLLAVAPLTRSMRFWIRRTAFRRNLDALAAAQVLTCDGVGMGDHFGGRALRDDPAAVHAGAGSQIDHIVRLANRVFIVFDDDDGVAQVTQVDQGVEQALIVALMQADRRFVENVHHADQSRTDLAGEADALRFATGEGVGAAVQREIAEADIAPGSPGGRRSP